MITAAQSLLSRELLQKRAAWCYLLLAAALAVVQVWGGPGALHTAVFLLIGGGCVAAISVGLRWHAPAVALPWRLVLTSSVLFLVAVVSRDVVDIGRTLVLLPEAFAIAGYLSLSGALAGWLSARGAGRDTNALLDAALVGTGGALVAWALLVAPALQAPGLSAVQRGLYALYPVLDAVLLALVARLAFSQAARQPAFWLVLSCMTALFVGDVVYALRDVGVPVPGAGFADVPYLLAYASIGAAALHPSMAALGDREPSRVTGWTPGRLCAVAAALLTTVLLPLVAPASSVIDRGVRAVLSAVLINGLFLRAVCAVNRHAASEAAARWKATHDQLTGLPNRALLIERLATELMAMPHSAQRLSVLFLDLDGFKLVNDSHGHDVGDELLAAAADRLRRTVREGDLVARVGGDEFVVVGRHDELAGAEGLAARVLDAFAEPFQLKVGTVFVSTSIGIAQTGGRYARREAGDLLRDADTAMYRAKAAGRSGYAVFDQGLRDAVRNRMDIETALRFALERGEFELHYQPIHDLERGHTTGHEALLRWRHAQRGLLPPAQFLPVAEELGLVVPIGAWAVRNALQQLASWQCAWDGGQLYVTVNVSARQLQDTTLAQTVRHALAETGLPGSALWLELTETAVIDDSSTTRATLAALRALGVVLVIDDFGTGYCALSYLSRLPISVVKLDREFVAGLGQHDDTTPVVKAVMAMAYPLGLQVVAEGVETDAHESAVRALGCTLVQGYRYGRPQPATEIRSAQAERAQPRPHSTPLAS